MAKINKSLMAKLRKQSKNYQNAEAKSGSNFADLPDGDYTCKITAVDLHDGNNGIAACYRMTVVDGSEKGKSISKWDNLETTENWEWAKGTIAALEIEPPDDIEGFASIIENESAVGLYVSVHAKGRDWQGERKVNYYINELVDGGGDDEDATWTEEDILEASKDELIEAIEAEELDGVSKKKAAKLKLKKLQKLLIAELPEDDEDDDDDEEDSEDDDDSDDDADEDDEDVEDDEEPQLPKELQGLKTRALSKEMKERGMSMAGTKGIPLEELQAMAAEFLAQNEEDGDEDDDDDDPDFEDMSIKELKSWVKDSDLPKKVQKNLLKIKDRDDLEEAIDDAIEDMDDED